MPPGVQVPGVHVPDIDVRRAEVEDAASIVALESGIFGSDAWSRDAVVAELIADNRRTAVAEIDDVVVGYVAVSVVADVADLTRIAVASDVRRLGAGAVLLAWAVEEARVAGAERMLLEVAATNEPAIGLYKSAGFAEIARRDGYYRGAVDALVLERPLQ